MTFLAGGGPVKKRRQRDRSKPTNAHLFGNWRVSGRHLARTLAPHECGAMQYSHCDAPIRLRLPDGRTLRYKPIPAVACYGRPGYERGELDALPSLEASWLRAESGGGHPITDNGTAIDTMVGRHNAAMQNGCGCAHAGGGHASGAGAAGVVMLVGTCLLAALRRRRSAKTYRSRELSVRAR